MAKNSSRKKNPRKPQPGRGGRSVSLHEQVEAICQDSHLGIGISLKVIQDLFGSFSTKMSATPPVTLPIPLHKINITILPVSVPPPKIERATGLFIFEKVAIDVVVHENGKSHTDRKYTFTTFHLLYDRIEAEVYIDGNSRLRVKKQGVVEGNYTKTGVPSSRLIEDHFKKSADDYKYFEFMLLFNTRTMVPDVTVGGVQFPNYLGALGAFKLAGPLKIALLDEYLLLYGTQVTVASPSPNCPKAGDAKEELKHSSEKPQPDPDSIKQHEDPYRVDDFSAVLSTKHPTPAIELLPHIDTDKLFIYLPKVHLLDFSSGALVPSLTAHDRWSVVAYYEYIATLGLKKINLDLVPSSLAIAVSGETEFYGKLSVGLEILCIRFEVFGIEITADVKRLNVEIGPTIVDGAIVLTSRQVGDFDLEIKASGSFPLGMVIALVVASIGRLVIQAKIAEVLNSLRVKILDIPQLLLNLVRPQVHTSRRQDSLLLSLVDNSDGRKRAPKRPK